MLTEEDKQVLYRAETRRPPLHNKKGKSSHRRVLQRQRASLVTQTTLTEPHLVKLYHVMIIASKFQGRSNSARTMPCFLPGGVPNASSGLEP